MKNTVCIPTDDNVVLGKNSRQICKVLSFTRYYTSRHTKDAVNAPRHPLRLIFSFTKVFTVN